MFVVMETLTSKENTFRLLPKLFYKIFEKKQLIYLSKILGLTVFLIALTVLFGWEFNIVSFKSLLPNAVSMNPLTAIAFILAGVSLIILSDDNSQNFFQLGIAKVFAYLIILISILRIADYLFPTGLSLDKLLFFYKLDADTLVPNRMAPNTALCFLFTGMGLLFMNSLFSMKSNKFFIHIFPTALGITALLALVGYLYSSQPFYKIGLFIPMAVNTALCFLLIAIGMFAARSNFGFMKLVTSNSFAGALVRVFIPVNVLIPLIIGWFGIKGEKMAFYDYSFAIVLIIVSIIITLAIITWYISQKLLEEELKRAKVENILIAKNKSINDSITYASFIQKSLLPTPLEIKKSVKDFFIFYKPKDIVSGDFYVVAEKHGKVIVAAVDCTGHGVPGAFMSMIGNDHLNHIIMERGITRPSEILMELNRGVKQVLKQKDHESTNLDGMDIAICAINHQNMCIEYAGAMRPLYYMNGELKETKGDKVAIGGTTNENYEFRNHTIPFKKGEMVYLFSDGYSDQFGGKDGKKFKTKNLKNLLLSIREKSMKEQEEIINNTFEEWKSRFEQVDDVLLMGIKL